MLSVCLSCVSMQEEADELYNIAMACNEREKVPVTENGIVKIENEKVVMRRPKGTCEEEWAAWNEAEERIINAEKRRAARKGPTCPDGQIAYCDTWCMTSRPEKRKWACVDQYIFRDMMRY